MGAPNRVEPYEKETNKGVYSKNRIKKEGRLRQDKKKKCNILPYTRNGDSRT
jgi:hypothetical protein